MAQMKEWCEPWDVLSPMFASTSEGSMLRMRSEGQHTSLHNLRLPHGARRYSLIVFGLLLLALWGSSIMLPLSSADVHE